MIGMDFDGCSYIKYSRSKENPVSNHANHHNLGFDSYCTAKAIKVLPKEQCSS